MNNEFDDDAQTTIDPWLDGQAPTALEPQGGWNYPADVAAARKFCRDLKFAALKNERGKQTLRDLAKRIRAVGVSEDLAADLIYAICEPPFSKGDVLEFAAEVYANAEDAPGLNCNSKHQHEDWAEEESDDSWLEGGGIVWPRPILYDTRQNNSKLAETFLAERSAKLILSDNVLFTLDDHKIWREIPDLEIAAEIRQTDPILSLDPPRIFAIITAIKVAKFTKAQPYQWIDEPADAPLPINLIPFRNGLLDFESGKLIRHNGQYFATGLPDFNFNPDATCPLWLEKLDEWLDPSFHPTLQEFIGYSMTPDTSIETILAMIGAARGGKGTIAFVMQSLVGPDHHCARTLNDLAGDFGLDGVQDKRLLFIPDAHSTDSARRGATLERLKSISGNDILSVNRKNRGIVNVRIPAKIVLIANQHPKFLDESGGLESRELLLDFRNSFRGKEDRALRSKLAAELPGIAVWALEGLARLRENGNKFTVGDKGKKASQDLLLSQSPALRFARDNLIVTGDPDNCAPLATAYAKYEEWATYTEGLNPRERRSRDDFKNDLIAALGARGVTYERRRWRDPEKFNSRYGTAPRIRGFFGVKLKGE